MSALQSRIREVLSGQSAPPAGGSLRNRIRGVLSSEAVAAPAIDPGFGFEVPNAVGAILAARQRGQTEPVPPPIRSIDPSGPLPVRPSDIPPAPPADNPFGFPLAPPPNAATPEQIGQVAARNRAASQDAAMAGQSANQAGFFGRVGASAVEQVRQGMDEGVGDWMGLMRMMGAKDAPVDVRPGTELAQAITGGAAEEGAEIAGRAGGVEQFIASIPSLPATMMGPRELAAMAIVHVPTAALARDATMARILKAIEGRFGPRVAGATAAYMQGQTAVPLFSGAAEMLRDPANPVGAVEAGFDAIPAGAAFGVLGAAARGAAAARTIEAGRRLEETARGPEVPRADVLSAPVRQAEEVAQPGEVGRAVPRVDAIDRAAARPAAEDAAGRKPGVVPEANRAVEPQRDDAVGAKAGEAKPGGTELKPPHLMTSADLRAEYDALPFEIDPPPKTRKDYIAAVKAAREHAKEQPREEAKPTDVQQRPEDVAQAEGQAVQAVGVGEGTAKGVLKPQESEKRATAPAAPPKEPPDPNAEAKDPTLTAAKNEWMRQDRALLGLDEIDSPSRRSWARTLEDAKTRGVDRDANTLAAEVMAKPRPLSDTETAGMVIRAAQIKGDHAEIMRKIEGAKDAADAAFLAAEAARKEAEFDALSRALKKSGTEQGRALASRKLAIDADMSLVAVKARATAAKGKALTEAEAARLDDLVKRIEAAEREIASLNTRIKEHHAERAVRQSGRTLTRQLSAAERAAKTSELQAKLKTLLDQGCL